MSKKDLLQFLDYAPNPQINVAIHREKNQGEMNQHGHSFLELVYIKGGSGVHETGGFCHPIKRGDVLVIHPKRAHAYRETKRLSLINVLVRQSVIERCAEELSSMAGYHALFGLQPFQAQHGYYTQRLKLDRNAMDEAYRNIDQIEILTRGKTALHRFSANAWLNLLLAQLVEAYGGLDEDPQNPTSGIALVMAHLESSIKESPTLPSLAQMAGMSERTFLRRFREATGYSPIKFHLRCRIRQAERLLLQTQYSISEVAEMSGFEDSNYFTRQFRQAHGLSPRQWRLK